MPSGLYNPPAKSFQSAILSTSKKAMVLVCCIFLLSNPRLQAQSISSPSTPTFSSPTGESKLFDSNGALLSQVSEHLAPPGGTILPTDVLPLPAIQNRMSVGENIQLRVFQKLPSRFYFSTSVESSFRYETNPYQFPTKRQLLSQLPPPSTIRVLNAFQQAQIMDIVNLSNNDDMVFRVLPNVTGGWTVTPRTRIFTNYFLIRDSLFRNIRLNTVIHSIAYGVQHDFPIGSRGNLQAEFQCRELYQLHQQPVFDYLPGLTFSYVLTPRIVLFVNALAQLRGKAYFQAPTKEMDPFYTWGALFQRNGWTFSASTTFLQNFREPFRGNATIPVNNYSFISDFEVARRLFKSFPGMQGFVRAESIYNLHSHDRPGLAGVDFRLFFGLRFAMAKPSLLAGLEQLRQQIEEQEIAPPVKPQGKPSQAKPSAFTKPYEVTASMKQPIHGVLPLNVVNAISEKITAKADDDHDQKQKIAQKIIEPKKQKSGKLSRSELISIRHFIQELEDIKTSESEPNKKIQIAAKLEIPREKKKDASIPMVIIPPFSKVNLESKQDPLGLPPQTYPLRAPLH